MSEDHHHSGHGEQGHHGDHHREKPAEHHGDAHHGHQDHHAHMVADFRQRFWISLALTLPVLILSPMIQGLFRLGDRLKFAGDVYVLFVLSTAIFVYGGFPFLKGMIAEVKALRPGMMTLISLAVSVAYIYSCAVVFGLPGKMFFWELASLIDIMLLGHWIEMKSVMGASRALEALVRLMPSEAHRLGPEGQIDDVAISGLNVGDRILIKPAEKAPADGRVVEGASSVNEAMLTGESRPVEKSAGDGIIGGSINGEGSLVVEIEKTGADSFLSQVIDLVRTAQESKSRTQSLANRAAFWLTLIAIGAGGLTFFVWLLVMDRDLAFALERTVSVMVITCPHALGLAVPLVVAVSTALSAGNGLLIRNRTAFEYARRLQAVVFDKTGTLTRGEFGISDVLVLDSSIDREKLLKLAASVESHSEHPIARGIVAGADAVLPVKDFEAIPGKGAQGMVAGQCVKVVSPGYLAENNIEVQHRGGENAFGEGETVVYVLIEDQPAGAIALGDVIREESREAIRELKAYNIQCMMLTGDNRHVAQRVSAELGLDDYFAEVLPEQKALKIKEVQGRSLVTAMVGDGVNDAPALAQADIGIAIGAGTDVAVETADIVLVRSNPRDVLRLIRLGRATHSKMVQNLIWATGYNIIAIPLAAGVLYSYGIMVSPAIAAVLMSLSTIIVAINARMLKLD